jgi:hypothetical protein
MTASTIQKISFGYFPRNYQASTNGLASPQRIKAISEMDSCCLKERMSLLSLSKKRNWQKLSFKTLVRLF